MKNIIFLDLKKRSNRAKNMYSNIKIFVAYGLT